MSETTTTDRPTDAERAAAVRAAALAVKAKVASPTGGKHYDRTISRVREPPRSGWDGLTPAEACRRIVRMFDRRDWRLFGEDAEDDGE